MDRAPRPTLVWVAGDPSRGLATDVRHGTAGADPAGRGVLHLFVHELIHTPFTAPPDAPTGTEPAAQDGAVTPSPGRSESRQA